MRTLIGSSIVVLLLFTSGCKTTGGKVFGTAAVVSGIGSVYLLTTSSTTIENGRLATQDDHMDAGAGLMFAAIAAVTGWFISECVLGSPLGFAVGGGAPVLAPAAVEPPAAPAAENGSAEYGSPAPVVIVVHADDQDQQVRRGWVLDPQDGQDKLYNRRGELIGRIDRAGYVWNIGGATVGVVDMSANCEVACRRARAHAMLFGSDHPRR
jgi:hypothetical protein